MAEVKLTDKLVRGVLICLQAATGSLSATEVTDEYNRRYPPWRIGKIILAKKKEHEIDGVLKFLLGTAYVSRDFFSFTTEAHHVPIIRYRLTNEGIQYLASLRH